MRINALGNTATDFASDDYLAIDGTTNGSRKMKNDSLLKVTAQNALAGNVAQEFNPARTSVNPYKIGEVVVYEGKEYAFKQPHYGAWDASSVTKGNTEDFLTLDIKKETLLVGANSTGIEKFVFCQYEIGKIKVTTAPNHWATDNVLGDNPTIFQVQAINSLGSRIVLAVYYKGQSVPSELELTVPTDTVAFRIFFRADVGEYVSVLFENLDEVNFKTRTNAELVTLDSSISKIKTDLFAFGQLNVPVEGANMTAVNKYLYVKGLKYIEVVPTPNPWQITSITPSANILAIYSVAADETEIPLLQILSTGTVPKRIFIELPATAEKIRLFVRADSGETVNFNFSAVANKMLGDVESVGFDIEGKNNTVLSRYVNVSRYINVVGIDVSPYVWAAATGLSNPILYGIDAEDENGTKIKSLYFWNRDTAPRSGPYYHDELMLPAGTARLKINIRALAGEVVRVSVHAKSEFIQISKEDKIRIVANSWRRNKRIAQCIVIGDPHDSLEGMKFAASVSNLTYDSIDCAICVGDICKDHPTESGAYGNYPELMKSFVPVLPVIGNHDVGTTYYIGNYLPTESIVSNVMGPAIAKGFIPNNTRGYYYKDFSSKKLRVIVVNQYEVDGDYGTGNKWERVTYDASKPAITFGTSYSLGDIVNIPGWTDYSYRASENLTTPASVPSVRDPNIPCWYGRGPASALFGQTQAQWIADTLLSTPANYAVVIAMHTWFSPNAVADETRKFTAKDVTLSGMNLFGPTDFLADLVDSFADGRNYSETVTFDTIDPYVVSCDFRNKNAGAKFMGFIGGHIHADIILKHPTKTWINAVHVSAVGSNSTGDIRMITNPGDAGWYGNLTLVGIDTANNALNLIKIGNKQTDDGYVRDCERIIQE